MTPIVELDRVVFVREGRRIIDRVSWRVERGRHWVVLGPNGSGKTTLLQLITGYLWPNEGHVRVLGQRYGETDLRALRRLIGWVSAAIGERFPPHSRALDIALSGVFASIGLYDSASAEQVARARQALADMDCERLAGAPWRVLSQGEKQRVTIARALTAEPALLILDEPCAGLDPAAREHFLRAIEALARRAGGPTLLMVTHHVEEIMPPFERTLLLKDGQVFAAGPTTATLTSAALSQTMGVALVVERANGRFRAYA